MHARETADVVCPLVAASVRVCHHSRHDTPRCGSAAMRPPCGVGLPLSGPRGGMGRSAGANRRARFAAVCLGPDRGQPEGVQQPLHVLVQQQHGLHEARPVSKPARSRRASAWLVNTYMYTQTDKRHCLSRRTNHGCCMSHSVRVRRSACCHAIRAAAHGVTPAAQQALRLPPRLSGATHRRRLARRRACGSAGGSGRWCRAAQTRACVAGAGTRPDHWCSPASC